MRLIAVIATALLLSGCIIGRTQKKVDDALDSAKAACDETAAVMSDWHNGGTNTAAQAAVKLITDTNKREKSLTDILEKIGLAILGILGIVSHKVLPWLEDKWNKRKERIRCSRKHKRN